MRVTESNLCVHTNKRPTLVQLANSINIALRDYALKRNSYRKLNSHQNTKP